MYYNFFSKIGTHNQLSSVKSEMDPPSANIAEEKNSINPEYGCRICCRQFTTARSLDRHRTVFHTNKKVPQCDICGRRFPSASNLKMHKYSHSNKKIFQCPKCNASFKYKQNLKAHKCKGISDYYTD